MRRISFVSILLTLGLLAQNNSHLLAKQLKKLPTVKTKKILEIVKENRLAHTQFASVDSNALLRFAKSYLGVNYLYGGNSKKGIDCSAFVQQVYRTQGKKLPRTAAAQFKKGHKITLQELKPGDLVFFSDSKKPIGHVGIFMGNNHFIHASSGANKVTITSLSKSYYARNFKGARRF